MMVKNYDQSIKINHNPNWPYIPNHPCRIIIIDGSGNDQISTKFIYMSKIHSNQSINCLLTVEKK